VCDQGGVAARGNILDDRADRLIDVSRHFALDREERAEAFGKISGCAVETLRHDLQSAGRKNRPQAGQWVMAAGASTPRRGGPRRVLV
jgi:hypothetical protein